MNHMLFLLALLYFNSFKHYLGEDLLLKNKIIVIGSILILLSLVLLIYARNTSNKKETFDVQNAELVIPVDSTKNLKIPIREIPLLYDAWTDGMDLENETDIGLLEFQYNRMQPEIIYTNDTTYYILINYNSGVKLCDYLLLKYSNSLLESLYLANGTFSDAKVSTTNNMIAINFVQSEGADVNNNIAIYNNIVVVHTDSMSMRSPIKNPYTYAVETYDWDENMLHIQYIENGVSKAMYLIID